MHGSCLGSRPAAAPGGVPIQLAASMVMNRSDVVQVASILNDFSFRAHEHVLNEVLKNWGEEDSTRLSNNTLMSDWKRECWNMSVKGD